MEGLLLIELADIIYIKADAGYSEIIVDNQSRIVSSKRLSHYEDTLGDKHFFRVHKSYIINLKYIKKYQKGRSGSITMADGTIIPVAENKKKALMDILKHN